MLTFACSGYSTGPRPWYTKVRTKNAKIQHSQPSNIDDNPFPLLPDGKLKVTEYPFEKVWAVMEKIYETGKVKAIGVSNFSIKTYVTFVVSTSSTSNMVP